jgi:hypothetical protein
MADQTLEQLRKRATELEIPGRSKIKDDADALAHAIAAREAELAAQGEGEGVPPAPEPATPDESGRPDLLDVAQTRASNRNPRVIGAE